MSEDYTICWYGPVYSVTGYGAVSRGYLKTLDMLGQRIKVYNTGTIEKEFLEPKQVNWLEQLERSKIQGEKIVLIHENPAILERIEILDAHFCAVITIFETDRIPVFWVKLLNKRFVDEVWVPSQFNVNTFTNSGVKKEKMFKLPYPIETSDKVDNSFRKQFFRILYVADFNPRKNIRQLISAYRKEFERQDNVELYLHTTTIYKEELKNFKSSLGELNQPRVTISDEKLDEKALKSLISTADLYISADKANGWGMPVMEAMALGVPVATVNWSGSTEFTNQNNSFLIEPMGLETVSFDIVSRNHLYLKHKWARIDMEAIQNVMREAYENTNLRIKIARQAHNEIQAFSLNAIGKHMVDHIEYIAKKYNKKSKDLRRINRFHFRIKKFTRNLIGIVQLKILYPSSFNLSVYLKRMAIYYLNKRENK